MRAQQALVPSSSCFALDTSSLMCAQTRRCKRQKTQIEAIDGEKVLLRLLARAVSDGGRATHPGRSFAISAHLLLRRL
jgi:hypothetical protein